MSPSMLSSLLYQDHTNLQSSTKLLQHNPLNQTPPPPTAPNPAINNQVDPYGGTNGFHINVIMVVSVLLCALICSIGLKFIVKCALRCSNRRPIEPNSENPNTSPSTISKHTGIKKQALKTFAIVTYSPDLNLPGLGTECVICLTDFAAGDRLRILPKCDHGFHTKCIDKWLKTQSSCPTCRQSLIETCQKIIGCDEASSSQSNAQSLPLPRVIIIDVAPLEREDLIRSYVANS